MSTDDLLEDQIRKVFRIVDPVSPATWPKIPPLPPRPVFDEGLFYARVFEPPAPSGTSTEDYISAIRVAEQKLRFEHPNVIDVHFGYHGVAGRLVLPGLDEARAAHEVAMREYERKFEEHQSALADKKAAKEAAHQGHLRVPSREEAKQVILKWLETW